MMSTHDIKRLGLILATQVEILAMSTENQKRILDDKSHAYNEEDFYMKASELRNLVYCPEEKL